jgi:hypothetical protein
MKKRNTFVVMLVVLFFCVLIGFAVGAVADENSSSMDNYVENGIVDAEVVKIYLLEQNESYTRDDVDKVFEEIFELTKSSEYLGSQYKEINRDTLVQIEKDFYENIQNDKLRGVIDQIIEFLSMISASGICGPDCRNRP